MSKSAAEIERATPWEATVNTSAPIVQEALPDIYYIIVDGYGRADLLQELYDYDNAEFIGYLEDRGFYVAAQSHSNYVQTTLSIASSMNFEYVNYLSEVVGDENRSREPLAELIQGSQIRAVLEAQGYQIVAFETGYEPTTIADADIYIPYRPEIVSDLEAMLLTSSAALALGPLVISSIRSESKIASSTSWVIMNTVCCVSPQIFTNSSWIIPLVNASKAPKGSSINSSFACVAKALAMLTR